MNKNFPIRNACRVAITAAVLSVSNAALAHTTFETSSMVEGVRVLNNVQIGHACSATSSVVATSVVFPDGKDSTIIVGSSAYSGPLTDFLTNWGPNIQPLATRAVFDETKEINDSTGNVVGFWAGGGPGVPNNMVAYVPFRVNATNIVPTSCAVSVRFRANIIDICELAKEADIHEAGNTHFWTMANLGTPYDATSTAAASLTITRNLETNPLPANCGSGLAVEVSPSAAQVMRDSPIKFNGVQVWPTP